MLPYQPPRLLDQVRQTLRLKHFSLKTEKSYIHYIREFILFHNKQYPREMGVDEIRAYLSHLAVLTTRPKIPTLEELGFSFLDSAYEQPVPKPSSPARSSRSRL